MTTKPPPLYYFNGITFNSGYYTIIDENPLTQAEADSRYLIKTKNDTTNNLQTFSAGLNFSGEINGPTIAITTIKSNTYQSSSINQLMTIGNNQISASATMSIGCNTGRLGNINIANTQTTGTANIVIGSTAITGAGSQNIQINRPLTIGYSVNSSSLSQIGGSSSVISANAVSISSTTAKSLISYANIPIGVYQVYYQIFHTILTTPVSFTSENVLLCDTQDSISAVLDRIETLNNVTVGISRSVGYYTIAGGGILINNVASETAYLNVKYTFSGGTLIAIGYIRLVRIG